MSLPKGVAAAVANKAQGDTGLRSQGDAWIQTQTSTFTNWANVQLDKAGHAQAEDDGIVEHFKTGEALVQVVRVCVCVCFFASLAFTAAPHS